MAESAPARWRAWGPVGLWLAVQLTATSLPGTAVPDVMWSADDLAHFGMYLGLGALVRRGAALTGRAWPPPAVWAALVVFAATDELHQLLIPGRFASLVDWTVDSFGAATGLWLGALIPKTRLVAWWT